MAKKLSPMENLRREHKRISDARLKCQQQWDRKQHRLAEKAQKAQDTYMAIATKYGHEEALYCSTVAPLQAREEVFSKAIELAEQGMDPVMAKLKAPVELEAERQAAIAEAELMRRLANDFDAIFDLDE